MAFRSAWIRVVLFLLAYTLLQAGIGLLQPAFLPRAGFSFCISLLLVFSFTRWADRLAFSATGIDTSSFLYESVLGLATGIALTGLITAALVALHQLYWQHEVRWEAAGFLGSLLAMLLIAVAEELVFRGYVLRNLMTFMPPPAALLLSAIVFAVFHAGNPGISWLPLLNIFLAGCLLGIRYLFSQKPGFGIGLHFSWNFLQGPVLGYAVSGISLPSMFTPVPGHNRLLTGGDFGLEGSVLCSIGLALFTVFFYLVAKRRVRMPVHNSRGSQK